MKKRPFSGASIEYFEQRLLLSVSIPTAHPDAVEVGGPYKTPLVSPLNGATAPYYPTNIRQFYGVNSIMFGSVIGDGTGQTIAVIDAYNDPKFVNSSNASGFATSDLHNFDSNSMWNIPDPPSFSVIPEAGQSLPTTYNSGWAGETALDVEWSHSIAPKANIVLVECLTASTSDLITNGVAAAVAAGATVVSMSFGGPEVPAYDSSFNTSSNVTYVASTGDYGVAGTGYPSLSPYVVAAGGTSITTSDSSADYGSEVVWNTSNSDNDGTGNDGAATGGGIASIESKPSYQSSETLSGSKRGVPDVSFEADPYTGVYVYDSSQPGSSGSWYEYGGTSLSSPCWAGLIAIADQGALLTGQTNMNGYNTTLPRLYQLPSSNFHDITSGNNTDTNESSKAGYSAGTGYDLASGIGTPVANALVPDLAGVGTVTGRVFVDNSGNGIYGGSDVPLAGKTVYLDLNNDNTLDNNEPSTTTSSTGTYTFTNEPAGGTVRLSSPTISGYVAVPASAAIAYGTTDTINITYFPITFSNTTAATNYTLQIDATNTYEQILINSSLAYSVAKSVLSSSLLTFSLTGTGDSLTVNGTNGNPVPTSGVTLTGAAGGDTLNVTGTASGNDTFVSSSSSISFNGNPVNFSNVSLVTLAPGIGTDALTLNSGTLKLTQRTGSGIITDLFSAVTINGSAKLAVAAPVTHATRTLVYTATLTIAGSTNAWTSTLDLSGNDLAVTGGNLSTVNNQTGTGYANGLWNGTGIDSSAAAGDSTHLSALGAIPNTANATFDGSSPGTSAVLVKFTYYGDANLSGIVDGSDYTLVDNGFHNSLTGWLNGDFNYDGPTNGNDYTLIDNAYDMQSTPLAAQIASASSVVAQSDGTEHPAAPVFSNQPAAAPIVFGDDVLTDHRRRAIADVGLTSEAST